MRRQIRASPCPDRPYGQQDANGGAAHRSGRRTMRVASWAMHGAQGLGRPDLRRPTKGSLVTSTPALRRRGPAERWLEALPLGNGRLGAMVWGDPRRATFSLNESTLWSGGPGTDREHRTPRAEASDALTRCRTLFENG